MKKIIMVMGIALLLLSCSGSDDTIPAALNTNGTVIKKIILNTGTSTYTGEYFYLGTRLAKVVGTSASSDSGTSSDVGIYTYTGNLVTKIDSYRQNVLIASTSLFYDANENLVSLKSLSATENRGSRVTYDRNIDGTMTITSYQGDLLNQNTVTQNKKAFFENGHLSKTETYRMINGHQEALTTVYSFDDKHNPLTAILGFDKLTYYDIGAVQTPNNVTAMTYSATNSTQTDIDEIEYTYNSYGFPVTSNAIDIFDDNGPPITQQFFYY